MFGGTPPRRAACTGSGGGPGESAKNRIGTKMGIKFLCPNGHKLHVKTFLSGKRAICPKCGARVVVPAEPTSVIESEIASGFDGSSSAILETASHLNPPAPLPEFERAKAVAATATATLPTASPSTAPSSDPIDESPSAVWYVRPATGGQFGPASGEIMRAWITEGRIGASSLVWRAGWEEWRAASAIFPQLGALLASPGVNVAPPRPAASAAASPGPQGVNGLPPNAPAMLPVGQIVQSIPHGAPDAEPAVALSQSLRKKRRKNDLRLISSAVLLVISIILVAVLIMIWRNQSAPTDTESADSKPATEIS